MALAGGCVTGMLWKAGGGSAALGVAIAGFAAGELLIRGPGAEVIARLDGASRPAERGLPGLLGVGYTPLALVLGVALLAWLLRRGLRGSSPGRRSGPSRRSPGSPRTRRATATGSASPARPTARAPRSRPGARLPYQLWLAAGVVAGGALAGRRRLVLPDAGRALRALAGGLLMGAGASVAHGCNIGHGLTGLPLLSLGSLLATAAMVGRSRRRCVFMQKGPARGRPLRRF